MTPKKILLLLAVLMLFSCNTSTKNNTTPKNVILLISDGTGLSQISSAFYFKETPSNYQRFQTIGLMKTSSSREDITDSAAGATAFAAGVKSYNGAIGVADDSTMVKNLVEIVSSKNIKTGMIATSSITHATPASFYAHVISRDFEEEIAVQLAESNIDFFAGGGLQFFNNRKDKQNILNTLTSNNFYIDTIGLTTLSSITNSKKAGYLLAKEGMDRISEGRGNFLPKATELGIQFLSKDNQPFFLMSEGSQIDWGGHDNDAPYLVSELIDFDNTIGKVLDFAEQDGNTLVIVTSDHETGGFTLASKKKYSTDGEEYDDYKEIEMTFSTTGHSASLIPVFAYGPGAEEFSGIYDNTAIFDKIMKVTNWE